MLWTFGDSLEAAIRFKAAFWGTVLGVMDGLVLSDAAWDRIGPLIIGRPDQRGSTGRDHRMSWRASFGLCARVLPGVIFQSCLAIGTAFSGPSVAEHPGCLVANLRGDVR